MCFEKLSAVPSSLVRLRSPELTRGMGFEMGGGVMVEDGKESSIEDVDVGVEFVNEESEEVF